VSLFETVLLCCAWSVQQDTGLPDLVRLSCLYRVRKFGSSRSTLNFGPLGCRLAKEFTVTETSATGRSPHIREESHERPPEVLETATVGARLKALRQSRGLSIRGLAELAGVPHATLSIIERDKSSPSVSILKRLLRPLNVTLSVFFSDSAVVDRAVFYKANELVELADGKKLSYRQVGANLENSSMMILHERYEPGADTGQEGEELYSHDAEEGGIVIEGRLEMTVGDEIRVLSPGDAYYFDSRLPHRMRNPFDEVCIVVSAVSPPTF
jgi:transcriptional regulator with XRE-family HTH domain